jgi:hypothetical protein
MKNIIPMFENQVISAGVLDNVTAFLSLMPQLPKYRYHHIQYIYYGGNLNEYFSKLCTKHKNLILLNQDIGGYKFTFPRNGNPASGAFFIERTGIKNLFAMHSITYPNIWNLFMNRIIKSQYPFLVRLYWKQQELKNALFVLEEKLAKSYSLVVKELSIKEKRGSKWERKYFPKHEYDYDSDRKWTSKSIKEVFDDADERGQWFKKVKFQLFNKGDYTKVYPLATCSITKYGHVFFDNLYSLITSNFLQELEQYIEKKIMLFQNRGLKERNYLPSEPLSIDYDSDVFKEKIDIDKFSSVIRKYPNATKVVFHGNPYFHASVADYKDGSSFDIWILCQSRFLIIPQIKTSIEGLERLVAYIFDNFEEGAIREYHRNEQNH